MRRFSLYGYGGSSCKIIKQVGVISQSLFEAAYGVSKREQV